MRDGKVGFPVKMKDFFIEDLVDIDSLKRAAKPYAGPEKTGVHNIVLRKWNILDVEIAFGERKGEGADPSAPRADFSVLQETREGVDIVFFEAKLFDSRELRAKGEPKVIDQIRCYADLLRRNRKAIIDSYYRVCCNFWNMSGINERNPERHKLLNGIVDGSRQLHIDEEPELAVFGFDEDQRVGKKWRYHREKLESRFGNKVHFRGSVNQGWPGLERR